MADRALPLFFTKVVGVNPTQHGGLKLDRGAGYGFAAKAAAIPLGLGEFAVLARHYPIVFASGPVPSPVALVGLNELGNLFVDGSGAWRAEAVVPGYARAWPFVLVEDPGKGGATYVGMEEGAACLGDEAGEALFADGKPTAVLGEAVRLCKAMRDELTAASALGRALEEAGLLREEEANVTFAAGGSARVRGFKAIAPDRLDAVADEVFLEWRRRGWLGAVYAHLHSAGNWARLIDLAAARAPAA
jgi:hypothetical protein